MILVNKDFDVKYFYRFIEFTSRLVGNDLTHERIKLIILDNFKAESKTELKVKKFSDAYLFLLNNENQILTEDILTKAHYLLTNQLLERNMCKLIIQKFYQNIDDAPHHLAHLIHLLIVGMEIERKTEFAFMLTNYVMIKKGRNPIIPYEFIFDTYRETIDCKNKNKLLRLISELEVTCSDKFLEKNISQEELIKVILSNKNFIQNKFDIKKLYLYGSYAKNLITENSDIDLLVIYNENLINVQKNNINNKFKLYLNKLLNKTIDILDFTHALENLDICEMENIITLI